MIQLSRKMPVNSPTDEHFAGCLICGEELIYQDEHRSLTCELCGQPGLSNVACPKDHYVCDTCHSESAILSIRRMLQQSQETDPICLLQAAFDDPKVYMHGPEHHTIVPFVLLTAYKNAGGDIDYSKAMAEAYQRSKKVPGGICGSWGVCGASVGAGIFASIATGSNPLNKDKWGIPMQLTSQILARLSQVGGPRCCKRTTRIAIEEAARFSGEVLGIPLVASTPGCSYHLRNQQCLLDDCPYYPPQASE